MDYDLINSRSKKIAGRIWMYATVCSILSGGLLLLSAGRVDKLFAQSYLFGWSLFFAASAGSLLILVLHSLLSSNWGRLFQGFLDVSAGARMWVLAAIGFVPIVLLMDRLYYKWIFPGDDQVILHKAPFLNTSGWILRAIIYFVLLATLGYILSNRQNVKGWINTNRRSVAAAGAVVGVLIVSLISVDWYMSIEPHWFSTIYGVWLLSGYLLTGLCIMTLAVYRCLDGASLRLLSNTSVPKDIGNLLLALTLFWSYIAISQYLIIWSGNLPEFNTFYIIRQREGWEILGLILIVGHFLVPFMALLSPSIKRDLRLLSVVALWILVMRFVDMVWNIAPLYGRGSFGDLQFWTAHVASAGLFVALWVAIVAYSVKRKGILDLAAVRGES